MRVPFAIAAGAGAVWSLPAPTAHVPPLAHALGIATTLVLPGPHLTLDGGPYPETTPGVLELLRARDITATFFLVGEHVRRSGALRDEIEAAGHAIGLHGDTQRRLLLMTPRAVRADLDRGEESVRPTADLHRPPGGTYSLPALYEVMRRGFNPLLWSRSGPDAAGDLDQHDVLRLSDADHYAALPAVLEAMAQQPR